ncbi:oxidoreductase [Variovorax sp. J22G73]|uniref:oxidoreductase n=1 Tax=unclassified Variovorax TaxID=663243 RepID=UPI0025749F06|nr:MULTISPECIES: oxidoreductase [unclassified Variovorax]MDM0008320.1 oxidoreductase [Variovorax sp. J22R203]MDM0100826.1 oxidoreductase [Variovorax sp. J22G73]
MTFSPHQKPLPSGFGPTTTAQEALGGRDLRGKTAIVTGGYSGLGLETARVLAGAGAHVFVPARSADKARAALAGIDGATLGAIDLMDPASIDAFAEGFLASGRALDILVNSAGVMAAPLSRDAQGHESQFSSNHLGHFRLTARLWPALRQAHGARVVSVSSRGHRITGVDFEDPDFERRPYDPWLAYGQSKTANALFAVGLDARGKAHGVRAFSVHPGSILTDLARHIPDDDLAKRFNMTRADPDRLPPGQSAAEGGDFKTVAQGAATSVWCAASTQLDGIGGVYCENVDVAPIVPADHPATTGVRAWAIDPALAERLWQLSERLTGVRLEA